MDYVICFRCWETVENPKRVHNKKYCSECARERITEYQEKYQKKYYTKNKDRYRYRWIKRLGTNQDKQILKYIKNKREGRQTPKYKQLPLRVFKHTNQAQQSFPEDVELQEDKFNLNYDGERKGYTWVKGVGYVTEDVDLFFS